MENLEKKVLLYSGGMDSYIISSLWKPDIKLYIDIKGKYSEYEKQRLSKDVIIETLDLSKFERDDMIIPLRNMYFIAIASYYGNNICLGATAGDRVLDKSFEFFSKMENILLYLYQKQWWLNKPRNISIDSTYKNYTKLDLLKLYLKGGGDIKEVYTKSFSCYSPDINGNECWDCKACFRKWVTFASIGFIKHTKPISYMKKNVIPKILDKTYRRGIEEEKYVMQIYEDYNKGRLCK